MVKTKQRHFDKLSRDAHCGRRDLMTATADRNRIVMPQALATQSRLMIAASDVSKTYNTGKMRLPALRSVNFSVSRSEMVAIMGPSGCGKTTLLNCLSGLDTIDSGSILIDGVDLSKLSDNARTDFRARQMGFIFQFYNLLPVLSAVENVELPLLVSGTKPKEARV